MNFDVLIIGGGAAGMSAALLFGSAQKLPFAKDKKIGVILHQRSSALQSGLFNNVLGLSAGTLGKDILLQGKQQLENLYPSVVLIEKEKVVSIEETADFITINTNKNKYTAHKTIVAVGPKNFSIKGLEKYTQTHAKLPTDIERTQLKNDNHVVTNGIYVAGVLAGHRSQFSIAAGSGTAVAADILSEWNNHKPVKVHDAIQQ